MTLETFAAHNPWKQSHSIPTPRATDWKDGSIPRVATNIKDRVNRLKAIGNGQVPQCMVAAWNILR